MDASKRMVLAKAMKAARAAKAGASSAPAAVPNPSSTLPLPPPTTTEAPLGSSSPSPHSPQPLQTPGSPPHIAAIPLVVASSSAPTPLDKGKRVLEIISDDEDSDGVAPFKRRKAARVPVPSAASPQGGNSFRDNLSPSHNGPRGNRRRGRICSTRTTVGGLRCSPLRRRRFRRRRPRSYCHPSSNYASDEGLQQGINARRLRQEGGNALLLGSLLGGGP